MTRQYPTRGLELEAREQRARNRAFLWALIPGLTLTALALAGAAWLGAWLMFFGGAL